MPKPYPKAVRDDVVRVARRRDKDVTLEKIADDFRIHAMTLSKLLRQAAIDDGDRSGVSIAEASRLRAANRRIKLLEQENEVVRSAAAYLSQANLPPK